MQTWTAVAAMQSISEDRKQTLGNKQNLNPRRAFTYDPSAGTWLKMERLDFLSTIDLRVALFLPGEENGSCVNLAGSDNPRNRRKKAA